MEKQKAGRTSGYSPNALEVAERVVLESGSIKNAYEALGISKATFYRWMDEKKEFREAIDKARYNRQRLKEREFLKEYNAAIESLNRLLTGYTKTLTEEEITEIIDKETGEVLREISRTRSTRQIYIPPNMQAIAKVLGPNDLRHNVYIKALEEYALDGKRELYELLFGKLGYREEVEKFSGIFVLEEQVDLFKIRYMEAYIQGLYDQDVITIKQWIEYTLKLKQCYSNIHHNWELRCQKLLDGGSYSQIILQIEELWKILIDTAADMLSQTYNLENGEEFMVPPEIQRQICMAIVDSVRSRQDKETYPIRSMPRA